MNIEAYRLFDNVQIRTSHMGNNTRNVVIHCQYSVCTYTEISQQFHTNASFFVIIAETESRGNHEF